MSKKATFGISKFLRGDSGEGRFMYLGWARLESCRSDGGRTISTLAFATYEEARRALGKKAAYKGWELAYFDGEVLLHSVACEEFGCRCIEGVR